jgi:hypothetical protein
VREHSSLDISQTAQLIRNLPLDFVRLMFLQFILDTVGDEFFDAAVTGGGGGALGAFEQGGFNFDFVHALISFLGGPVA